MAEVLRISPTHEPHFSTSSLRKTSSHTSLFLDASGVSQCIEQENIARRYSSSLSSSAPSSPRLMSHDLSSLPSCSSTPASSLSLRDHFCIEDEDHVPYPSDASESETESADDEDPTPSNSPPEPASPHATGRSAPNTSKQTSVNPQSAGDDMALENQPSRHVDYLSHEWEEEEIWSSWRHIVGKRRTLDNWERLENASWRTWAKSRGRLPTVSAETLNWMKDHDVTWLYGPLQSAPARRIGVASPSSTTRLSRTDSFVVTKKKSILKKRSLSEAMLQRSLSTSTLVKQAVDSLVSQGPLPPITRPVLGSRSNSEASRPGRSSFATPIETPDRVWSSSSSSSGAQTPGVKRHIHFSEKVEQCIAINEEAEYDREDEELESSIYDASDSESDDGVLMMQPEKGKERKLSSSRCATPRPSFSNEASQKTIAMLPATKLRGDTPEPPEPTNLKGEFWKTRPSLGKSSSQETLRPSRPSANFLWNEDGEGGREGQSSSPSSSHVPRPSSEALRPGTSRNILVDEDREMESRGLRRTPSGMFMPYDENEDDYATAGIFGKVIDTVNTAKDIAHVVWNVGWRR